MEVLMLKQRAPRKTPKLMLSLKELRCEGVNFNALGLVLYRYFGPFEVSHILWNGLNFGSISFVILAFSLLHLFMSVIWFSFEG
jgi:hypothetical protein